MADKLFNDLKVIAESVTKVANVQIAAVIVYKRQIISIGYNQKKTHPFQFKFSKNPEAIYLHAETSAIYNAIRKIDLKDFRKCSLYILRIKSDGSIGMSKPCMGCMKCISTFEIGSVFYTTENSTTFTKL